MGTFIVVALLVIASAAVIYKLIRDKKEGKSACGCDCGHCSMDCKDRNEQ
ncbi:MAG: FeoB-associated Cys-rich membrane protein [Lachnospiraceae bacterium]|jgi:hypothetical protein